MNLGRSGAVCVVATAVLSVNASADVVTVWQRAYQQAIRYTGGAPCPVSRGGPLLALAMYDAINSIDRVNNVANSYLPYQHGLPIPPAGASREAAANAAARVILLSTYGANASCAALANTTYLFQDFLIPGGQSKADGVAFGTAVANSLLALRVNDGYDADSSYTPGTHAGDWRQTPDGPNVPAFSPQWGRVRPWGILSGDQFRPTRLTDYGSMGALLTSQEYTDNINGGPGVLEVKYVGRRDSVTRTADETEIAWFWANDRDGTSKPPGQLVDISLTVSQQFGLTLSQNARLFALVNIAMGDGCIAAWDAKYNTDIDLWRPIDAIRETQDDGNPNTIPDPTWTPLNDFTPPFPAYVSGHGTMAAAHAGVMIALFGDNVTFTVGSDEFSVNPGLGYPPDLTRTFDHFSDAAWENALSRIYLGVHYYWDAEDANTLGYRVANWVIGHNLMRFGDLTGDGVINAADLAQMLGAWGTNKYEADLNGDGVVNSTDLALLLGLWN